MKVLLDECAPRQRKMFLIKQGYECVTVQEAGWSGIGNGKLLALADPLFDAFITIDVGIRYQQNLGLRKISIVIVRGRSNRLRDLVSHFSACAEALKSIHAGQVLEVGAI